MPATISIINGFPIAAASATNAESATSASYALTASVLLGSATSATSASYALTASVSNITNDTSTNFNYFVTFTGATASNQPLRVDSNTLTFNPSTNTLTVANLAGNATTATNASSATNASNATNIAITNDTTTNATYYPTFVSSTSGNNALRVDSSTLTWNPSTNTLTAANFAGNASTATSATSAQTVNTITSALDYEFFPTFVDADNGSATAETVYTDAGIRYNPSTNILTTTASNATNATNIAVTNTTTGTGPYYLVFADGTTGNRTARVDSSTLTFNATTNTLTAGTFDGTASYASQSGYTIQFVLATSGSNLAASTTYRMGAPVRAQLTTAAGTTRIYVPRPGKVRYAAVCMRVDGTLASAGTTVVQFAKNTTVGENIGTPTTFGSTTLAVVSSSAISMSLVQGDFVEINVSTPAWGTLPTRVECSGIIYIENNA